MAEPFEHIQKLAELFLSKTTRRGQAAAAAPATEAPAPAIREPAAVTRAATGVEIILVGHLPVRAGLWLTQYADDVATDDGPTALVRLNDGQQVLEILRGRDSAARASSARDIFDAIADTRAEIARWIIRPSSDDAKSILLAAPDSITILSGADEAATVAAYTLLKDLREAAAHISRELPPIGIAILGADPRQAEEAFERIRRTAQEHLILTVTLERCVKAMGSLGSTLHFRFSSDADIDLRALIGAVRGMSPQATREGEMPPQIEPGMEREPAVTEEPRDRFEPALADAEPDDSYDLPLEDEELTSDGVVLETPQPLRMLATPVPPSGFDVPARGAHESTKRAAVGETVAQQAPPPAVSTARVRPKPSVQIEAKHMAPSKKQPRPIAPSRALCSWIDGLALLEVRCAAAKEVEIAVDTMGELHLIGWHDQLREVHTARGWLESNRALVAAACSEHMLNTHGEITIHLVASAPAQVSDLYGSMLKLHVLAPVEVEGKTGWYAAALNT